MNILSNEVFIRKEIEILQCLLINLINSEIVMLLLVHMDVNY